MEGEDKSAISISPPSSSSLSLPSPVDDTVSCPLPEGKISTDAEVALTDDIREKIVRQVEYYFSDENLPTDKFLLKHVKKNKEGFVPISLIASFKRMKKLAPDQSRIEAALRTSSLLVVSPDGKKIKRLHPLPDDDVDAKSRTVLVENLAKDHSTEYFQSIFGKIGNIKNISIHDPTSTEESAKSKKTKIPVSNKLHALVEYETVEAAESAVASLNDLKNWRSGLRVELLHLRMEKYGLIEKARKGTHAQKNHDVDVELSDAAKDGEGLHTSDRDDLISKKKELLHGDTGGKKSRKKNRERCHYQVSNEHGHTCLSSGSSTFLIKPLLGPRMPDGTRGFTMGRGKPIVYRHN